MGKASRARQERKRRERHKQIIAGSERYVAVDDEPAAKKFARLEVWLQLARRLGGTFRAHRFLVLCSAEAGDVGCLLALGVEPASIKAVDLSEEAVAVGRQKYPDVSVVRGDVFEVARQWPHSVAMLDFCGPMSDPLVEQVARCASVSHVRNLCLGYMRGRERPTDRLSVKRHTLEQRLTEKGTEPDSQTREYIVESSFGFEMCDRGGVPVPWYTLQYQTRVPMTYQWFEVAYGGSRRTRRAQLMAQLNRGPEVDHERLRQRSGLTEERMHDGLARIVRPVKPDVGAKLLNITPGRLAAWKAWQARRELAGPDDPFRLRELYTLLWGGGSSPALV